MAPRLAASATSPTLSKALFFSPVPPNICLSISATPSSGLSSSAPTRFWLSQAPALQWSANLFHRTTPLAAAPTSPKPELSSTGNQRSLSARASKNPSNTLRIAPRNHILVAVAVVIAVILALAAAVAVAVVGEVGLFGCHPRRGSASVFAVVCSPYPQPTKFVSRPDSRPKYTCQATIPISHCKQKTLV